MRFKDRIRFDRNELAGSFGDIGTDLPLIVGIILASGASSANVFTMFGLMQITTGIIYGMPMAVQPLKAMAVLVIAQKLPPNLLYGGGMAIGTLMLILSSTPLLSWITKKIPHCVVRGIQFGLGLSLASIALKQYVPSEGFSGYILAGVAFVITVALWGNRRFPAALFVILIGVAYAFLFKLDVSNLRNGLGWALPEWSIPSAADVLTGFFVLALPQLPLSISNSVIATNRTVKDLFPDREISVRKIGLTYAVMNLVNPFFGGVPVCHGCGGLAGHYAFGGRTGGSVIIYGAIYLLIGLFFSGISSQVIDVFPKPILGVILSFEAIVLMLFARDIAHDKREVMIAMLVALAAFALPQGYLVGMILGIAIYYMKPALAK